MWIYGANSYGKMIQESLVAKGEFVNGFIDDIIEQEKFMGFPLLRSKDIEPERIIMIIGIEDNLVRKEISTKFDTRFGTVIHPQALVSNNSFIDNGTVILAQAVINADSYLGKHNIIKTRVLIESDCKLDDYVHLGSGVIVCENVSIGQFTSVGPGTIICKNVKIGNDVQIDAGCVIKNDIPDNSKVRRTEGRDWTILTGENKADVYIVGAGGFGREIESWVYHAKDFSDSYVIKGFIDIDPDALAGYPSDFKVVGNDEFIFKPTDYVLLGIADVEKKEDIVTRLKDKVKFLTFISDTSFIGKSVKIGEGTIIGPGCVITTNIEIGRYVSVITGTVIGHDSFIGDYSSLMVHVEINGNVRIGEKTFIGSNSTLIPGIKVGKRSIIGVGSIVISDLPDGSFAYGNPAKNYSGIKKKD